GLCCRRGETAGRRCSAGNWRNYCDELQLEYADEPVQARRSRSAPRASFPRHGRCDRSIARAATVQLPARRKFRRVCRSCHSAKFVADRQVERAIRWESAPQTGVHMGKKLYVGNLPFNTTDDSLQEMFAQVGSVSSAKVIMDRDTKRSKGFGFVEM